MNATIDLQNIDLLGPLDENIEFIQDELQISIQISGSIVLFDSFEESNIRTAVTVFEELVSASKKGKLITKEFIGHLLHDAKEGALAYKERATLHLPSGHGTVYPRNKRQADFLVSLSEKDLVFGVGPAGTGKTFLAIAWAVFQLLTKKKRKLLLTRPVVEAGENLGFLPGDLQQKLQPYVRPLYDALETFLPHEILQKFESQKTIEVAPLAYMRGRSLRDAIIILDEAQNTTAEQMKMFLTRIGENSQAIVCGDDTQIDLPRNQMSGLKEALVVLKTVPDVETIRFYNTDVIRSKLVRNIIAAYDKQKEQN